MPDTAPRPVQLSDYQPFTHLVRAVELTFHLAPKATRVLARLTMAPNPARPGRHDLRLDGEGLALIGLAVDGRPLDARPDATGLTIPAADLPDGPFTLQTEVRIAPEGNTALEGLYMSNGMYCTQCEAEGFRKITFYPDRPDVMAPFTVRIEGDLPILLSNGNPHGQGPGWAEWHDPWPKPAYLFALVAGELRAHADRFTTRSGREVALNIWVRPGDEDRCAFAMDALKRSMRWDETTYGREYDLDVFNIVAVDDFNMGAMENKGLNIFNSKFVLARPDTATDDDFDRIEAIIAHEYFHNWTGNRITCRDWFQLCLKEGLTVFRDQQFSGDIRGPAVKRIEDVILLRARQFREDAGPLAHPVRPDSYVEINNFYTATIYEKGAEVIGMLKRLVGDEGYARALDLYFDRHDGQAATIEDWLAVFQDATGRDLSQFKRWYTQAGTPRLKVYEAWDAGKAGGTYTLTLAQVNPPTPGQPDKDPKVIPVAVGLLGPNGDEVLPTEVLELTQPVQSFRFEGLGERPVPSILRGFSAPVILEHDPDTATRAFLLEHDTDPFNKWEAGRALAKAALVGMAGPEGTRADQGAARRWTEAMAAVAADAGQEPAFRALCLRLPAEDDIAQTLHAGGHVPDPARIHAARHALGAALAEALGTALPAMIAAQESGPPEGAAGRRALLAQLLALQTRRDGGALAATRFAGAKTMTDSVAALACLLEAGAGAEALAAFEARWQGDRLVMDKWFALQLAHAAPEALAPVAARLIARPDFEVTNPNRFRAVYGTLAAHHAGFHHASGAAYRLLAEGLIRLDPLNPQTAARLSSAFDTWPRYDADRQGMIREELDRIAATPGLSRDLRDMVDRMRAAG